MVEIPRDKWRLGRKAKIFSGVAILNIILFFYLYIINDEKMDVEAFLVGTHDFTFTATGYGYLIPEERFSIVSEVPGTIYSIEVNAGDSIQRGDVLFRLVNPIYESLYRSARNEYEQEQARHQLVGIESELEIKQLESRLRINEAEMKQREALLEAQSSLVESSIVSQQDFLVTALRLEQIKLTVELVEEELQMLKELVRARMRISNIALRQSNDGLETAKDNLDNLNVRAQMSGVFQQLSDQITLGTYISEGDSFGIVANHSSLIAQVQIPSDQAANINLNSDANIQIRDQIYSGYVRRISPNVSRNLVRVDIAFNDSVPMLARPNLEVRAELVMERASPTNAIRVSKRLEELEAYDTFVASGNGNFLRQSVTFGRRKDNFVEILDGAVEGDSIIFLPKSFDGETFGAERLSN